MDTDEGGNVSDSSGVYRTSLAGGHVAPWVDHERPPTESFVPTLHAPRALGRRIVTRGWSFDFANVLEDQTKITTAWNATLKGLEKRDQPPTALDPRDAPPVKPIIFEEKRRFHGRCRGVIANPPASATTFSPQPLKVPIFQVENLAADATIAGVFAGGFFLRRPVAVVDDIQVFTYVSVGRSSESVIVREQARVPRATKNACAEHIGEAPIPRSKPAKRVERQTLRESPCMLQGVHSSINMHC